MELQDTIDLMKSSDFKDRFKSEYYQLKIRTERLVDMLDKYKDGTLGFTPKCSSAKMRFELLDAQCGIMKAYLHILKERASIEDIEL